MEPGKWLFPDLSSYPESSPLKYAEMRFNSIVIFSVIEDFINDFKRENEV